MTFVTVFDSLLSKECPQVLFVITAEMAQDIAESNLDRKLTEQELELIHDWFVDDAETRWRLDDALFNTILEITEDSGQKHDV